MKTRENNTGGAANTRAGGKISKFLWLDMEMTGLDPEREAIIEIAAIVTNHQHEELDQYHKVIKQDSRYLENMDKWNTRQHKKSGLYDLVPGGITQYQAEQELLALMDKHFGKERVILAGNSIFQDRLFIKKNLLQMESRLHYRMLDVSAWKIIFLNKNIVFKKENKHRALDDIRESIREMKLYLSYLNTQKILKDAAATPPLQEKQKKQLTPAFFILPPLCIYAANWLEESLSYFSLNICLCYFYPDKLLKAEFGFAAMRLEVALQQNVCLSL